MSFTSNYDQSSSWHNTTASDSAVSILKGLNDLGHIIGFGRLDGVIAHSVVDPMIYRSDHFYIDRPCIHMIP